MTLLPQLVFFSLLISSTKEAVLIMSQRRPSQDDARWTGEPPGFIKLAGVGFKHLVDGKPVNGDKPEVTYICSCDRILSEGVQNI